MTFRIPGSALPRPRALRAAAGAFADVLRDLTVRFATVRADGDSALVGPLLEGIGAAAAVPPPLDGSASLLFEREASGLFVRRAGEASREPEVTIAIEASSEDGVWLDETAVVGSYEPRPWGAELAERRGVCVFPDGNVKSDTVYGAVDPLTGDVTLVTERPVPPQRPELVVEADLATSARCPFCADRIEAMATYMPASLSFVARDGRLPDGAEVVRGPAGSFKIRYDDCWAVANIAAYDDPSLLVVIGERHARDVEELSDETLVRAFRLAIALEGSLRGAMGGASLSPYHFRHTVLAWNFLPCSGGSLLHPHLQLIMSASPGGYVRRMIDHSRSYALAAGEDAFEEAWRGALREFAVFEDVADRVCVWPAPKGVLGEIAMFFTRAASLADLSTSDVKSVIEVTKRAATAARREWGAYSFNAAFIAPRFPGDCIPPQYRLVFRVYNSPTIQSPDATFFDYVYRLPVVYVSPRALWETLAR